MATYKQLYVAETDPTTGQLLRDEQGRLVLWIVPRAVSVALGEAVNPSLWGWTRYYGPESELSTDCAAGPVVEAGAPTWGPAQPPAYLPGAWRWKVPLNAAQAAATKTLLGYLVKLLPDYLVASVEDNQVVVSGNIPAGLTSPPVFTLTAVQSDDKRTNRTFTLQAQQTNVYASYRYYADQKRIIIRVGSKDGGNPYVSLAGPAGWIDTARYQAATFETAPVDGIAFYYMVDTYLNPLLGDYVPKIEHQGQTLYGLFQINGADAEGFIHLTAEMPASGNGSSNTGSDFTLLSNELVETGEEGDEQPNQGVSGTNFAPQLVNQLGTQTITLAGTQYIPIPNNTFADPGDTLTYSPDQANGQPLPAGVSFTTGTRTYTIAGVANGTYSIRTTVTDSAGQTAQMVFTLVVNRPVANPAPVLASPYADVTITGQGVQSFNYSITSVFSDTEPLTADIRLSNGQPLPTGFSYDSQAEKFVSNANHANGTYVIRTTVTDSAGQTAIDEFVLIVNRQSANQPPVANVTPPFLTGYLNVPEAIAFPANHFSDPDGDSLTWNMEYSGNDGVSWGVLPAWSKFYADRRLWSFTPPTQYATGTTPHKFRRVASDGRGGFAYSAFPLTVTNRNVRSNKVDYVLKVQTRVRLVKDPVDNSNPGIDLRIIATSGHQPGFAYSKGFSVPTPDTVLPVPAFVRDGYNYQTVIEEANPRTGPEVIVIYPLGNDDTQMIITIPDQSVATDWVTHLDLTV